MLYPEATYEIIKRHRTWLEPTLMDPASGQVIFAFHSIVTKTRRATILVDTCSGNDKERPHKLRYHRKNWPYLANLAAAGFAPENIDYMPCTHLHADHVGWNTRLIDGRWAPTFPDARYLFVRQDGSTGGQLNCEPNIPPIPTMKTACCRSWKVVKPSWSLRIMPSTTTSGLSRGQDTRPVTCVLWCNAKAPPWS
jgi:hypothetical protein